MRRSDRHRALIDHLRATAPEPVPTAALAERYGVTPRTIERDLQALKATGVPIYTGEGRGAHTILPGVDLPPVQLSSAEAYACAVALQPLARSPLGQAATSAREKLVAALPADARRALRRRPARRPSDAEPSHPGAVWLNAILRGRVVRLRYQEPGGQPAVRRVEPYQLLAARDGWYLVGWCLERQCAEGFRADRVGDLALTETTFVPVHAAECAGDLPRWTGRPSAG